MDTTGNCMKNQITLEHSLMDGMESTIVIDFMLARNKLHKIDVKLERII